MFAHTLVFLPLSSPSCTHVPVPQPQCLSPALKTSAPASSVSGSPAWQCQMTQSSARLKNNHLSPTAESSRTQPGHEHPWQPLTFLSPATAPFPQPFKSFAEVSLIHRECAPTHGNEHILHTGMCALLASKQFPGIALPSRETPANPLPTCQSWMQPAQSQQGAAPRNGTEKAFIDSR